jgi:hypothetical protein
LELRLEENVFIARVPAEALVDGVGETFDDLNGRPSAPNCALTN